MFFIRFCLVALSLLVIGFSTGCGKKNADPVRASLSGKVTVKGQSLTGGTLLLQKDGKEVASLKIEADGTYNGVVPMGDLKVGVDTEKIKLEEENRKDDVTAFGPKEMEKMKELMNKFKDKKMSHEEIQKLMASDKVKYVPIPDKYRNPAQSGFTVTIQAGKNEKDFPIP